MRSGEDTVEDSGVSEAERTRISSAKLLSSPSRALTASKSNTNCARQQAQCDWGRCSSHGSGRRELPRTCGSVASPLSSGAFSVVRTRPVGKTNKVVSRQARPGASGSGAPGVLILVPACGISLSGACRNSVGRPQVDTPKCGTSPDQGKPA